MPSIPELILGLSLTTNPNAEITQTQTQNVPIPSLVQPFVGAKWKKSMLVAGFGLQHSHQYRKIGETEYISHEGITTIGIDYRATFLQKKSVEAFWGIGTSVDIPSVHFVANGEEAEALQSQIWVDLFSVGSRVSFGARKYWDQFFVGMRADQHFRWSPHFDDEFGTEQHFFLTSEGSVTFGWIL